MNKDLVPAKPFEVLDILGITDQPIVILEAFRLITESKRIGMIARVARDYLIDGRVTNWIASGVFYQDHDYMNARHFVYNARSKRWYQVYAVKEDAIAALQERKAA